MIASNIFKRPDKPAFMNVKSRDDFKLPTKKHSQEVFFVDKSTECHVTRCDVAERMVDYASPFGEVLEPSAGTGNIVHALLNYGVHCERITMVEKHIALASKLEQRFENKINVVNQCFLQFADEVNIKFDTIILNPPFRPIKHHVKAAQTLLNKGGRIVLLSPTTFTQEGFELIEALPENTFATTKVKTHILMYQN
jgi:methylase of polypeptide subunit release factors